MITAGAERVCVCVRVRVHIHIYNAVPVCLNLYV